MKQDQQKLGDHQRNEAADADRPDPCQIHLRGIANGNQTQEIHRADHESQGNGSQVIDIGQTCQGDPHGRCINHVQDLHGGLLHAVDPGSDGNCEHDLCKRKDQAEHGHVVEHVQERSTGVKHSGDRSRDHQTAGHPAEAVQHCLADAVR